MLSVGLGVIVSNERHGEMELPRSFLDINSCLWLFQYTLRHPSTCTVASSLSQTVSIPLRRSTIHGSPIVRYSPVEPEAMFDGVR